MRLYRWLCKPMPSWFDRGTFIFWTGGVILGLLLGEHA